MMSNSRSPASRFSRIGKGGTGTTGPCCLAVLCHPGGLIFSLLSSSSRINALRYVYTRLGISSGTALLLLFASLFGSYINIPVCEFPEREVRSGQEVIFFGMHYVVPVVIECPGTVVAVNGRGGVLPPLLAR